MRTTPEAVRMHRPPRTCQRSGMHSPESGGHKEGASGSYLETSWLKGDKRLEGTADDVELTV